jgi:hypothetical protein
MFQDPATRTASLLLVFSMLVASNAALYFALRLRRTIRREHLRFRLFEIRDRLYLAAMDGEVDARSIEFSAVRDIVNQVIRESDRAGVGDLLRILRKPGLAEEASAYDSRCHCRCDGEHRRGSQRAFSSELETRQVHELDVSTPARDRCHG